MSGYDIAEEVRQAAQEGGYEIILHFLALYDDGKITLEQALASSAFEYGRLNRHNQMLLQQQSEVIGLYGVMPPGFLIR